MKYLIALILLAMATGTYAQQFIHNPDCKENEIGVVYSDGKKGCVGYTKAEVQPPIRDTTCNSGWRQYGKCTFPNFDMIIDSQTEISNLKKRIRTLEKRVKELEKPICYKIINDIVYPTGNCSDVSPNVYPDKKKEAK